MDEDEMGQLYAEDRKDQTEYKADFLSGRVSGICAGA